MFILFEGPDGSGKTTLAKRISETFNIVGADLVSQGVPLVSSSEIPWHTPWFSAEPTESKQIYNSLRRTYNFYKINTSLSQYNLTRYTNKTRKIWLNYFKG